MVGILRAMTLYRNWEFALRCTGRIFETSLQVITKHYNLVSSVSLPLAPWSEREAGGRETLGKRLIALPYSILSSLN